MNRRAIVTGLIAFCMLISSAVAQQQKRGPSTPEERQRAVQIARALENNPLSKELQQDREWGILWLIQIPDITVSLCSDTAPWIKAKKYEFGGELTAVMMMSSAAYIIEHPDSAKDELAVNRAGLESALRAYSNLVSQEPKAKLAEMDAVIETQQKGELDRYVRDATKACKKSAKSSAR